jgi:class 3 adenylate cyclase
VAVCASCGHESPEAFRFCPSCGAPHQPPSPREVRKVVSIVFCDLTGSTALGDRTDPEALRATMRRYYEQMREVLERHGGTVEKFVGDAVMAVFGVPVAHEDDALRAVRAAWEMREAVRGLDLSARVGVNTGLVVAGDGDSLVTGDAVNVAARLEQAAGAGEILIGEETRRLVRDAVETEPVEVVARGKPAPLGAFRLLALDQQAPGVARRFDTPLVGRERELRLLEHAYERSSGERSCHLVTILGPAGVGKSRLVAEFLDSVQAAVVRGRCLGYGDGITFWPVIEVLKQLGAEKAIETIAVGASSANDLFWEVRAVLEETAASRPLVVVFDDIQWAEGTFLDLIDHVADLSRGAPILLLCLARPELLDLRPGWGGGKLNATTTFLEALTAEESARLLHELGDAVMDAPTRQRILAAAAGNPLFMEEMLALALEGVDVGAPPTINALLQARLDLLGEAERAVIERGAVEGEVFHRSAVQLLLDGAGDGVDAQLVGLVRKELIRPDRAMFPGDVAFRFRHLLIRDAAYDALPKEARAVLHARFAAWLATQPALIELDELAGYHLEQAARYHAELGKPDAELETRAGGHLAAAGQAALARSDHAAAASLLERSRVLLADDDPRRAQAGVALAEAAASDYERHDEVLAELLRSRDPVVVANARVVDAAGRFHHEPEGASDAARAVLAEVLPVLEGAGDTAGLARAAMLEFLPNLMVCQGGPATAALRRAIGYAQKIGDRRTEGVAALFISATAGMGSASATELEQIVAELEAVGDIGPSLRAAIAAIGGCALLCRNDIAGARERMQTSVALLGEIGSDVHQSTFGMLQAVVEFHADEPEAAIRILEPAAGRLVERGVVSYASTLFAMLAVAHQRCGRPAAAQAAADRCLELTAGDDVINFALVNGVRARLAADRDEHAEARTLAADALRWALSTDFLVYRGDAYSDLAYVLQRAGDLPGTREALEAALAEYGAKEDEPMIGRTQALLAALER